MRRMTPFRRALLGLLAIVALVLSTAGACDGDQPTSAQSEGASRDTSYDAQVKRQPAHGMEYSPTRETINHWIDTWDDPNAVSYVYLEAADGSLTGYYVLKGLPVSYCVGLTPPETTTRVDLGDANGDAVVPAPGVDGAYYSGAQCNTYYGFTADTGAYVEFSIGASQGYRLYNQPLPEANNVPNLAPDK